MLTPRVSFGAILLVFVTTPAAAQVSMEWSRPQPQGNPVLEFVEGPPGTVFGLSDKGAVLISEDGGATWSLRTQFEGYAATYSAAYAVDGALYVAGEFGLQRSYDLGLSWTPVPSPGSLPVASVVQPVPLDGALTICDGRYVHSSLDHGATWSTSVLPPPYADDLRYVDQHWFDLSQGRVVHDNGGFRTHDGGTTWDWMILIEPGGGGVAERVTSMHWTGAPWGPWNGILIGRTSRDDPAYFGDLYLSTDGVHWHEAGFGSFAALSLGGDRFLRVGSGLWETIDRGQTWTRILQVPEPLEYRMVSLGTSDANLLVGGDGGAIFHSTDDGATWSERTYGDGNLSSLVSISVGTTFGIAVREGDQLMTLDGGQSWTPVDLPVTDERLAVAQGSDFAAVAADDHFVALTFDAGATWRVEEVPSDVPPGFVTDGPLEFHRVPGGPGNLSILCRNWGEWGALDIDLLVRDGATDTWDIRETGLPHAGSAIETHAWATSQVGFVSTDYPAALYRTIDRGQSWHYIADLPGNEPRGTRNLVAASETDLWIIANCGIPSNPDPECVYRSTDGGLTWSMVDPGCDDPLRSGWTLSEESDASQPTRARFRDGRSVKPTDIGLLDGGVVVITGGQAVAEPRLTFIDPDDTVTCVDLPLTMWLDDTEVPPWHFGIGVTGFGADRVFVAKDFGALLAVDRTIVDVPPVPGTTGGPRLTLVSRGGSRFGFEVEFERAGTGVLRVFDVAGREVRTLWSGSLRAGVPVRADWDGHTASGARAAAGMYHVHLAGDGGSRTIRLPIIR